MGVVSSDVRELCKAVSQEEDSERMKALLNRAASCFGRASAARRSALTASRPPKQMILGLIDDIHVGEAKQRHENHSHAHKVEPTPLSLVV